MADQEELDAVSKLSGRSTPLTYVVKDSGLERNRRRQSLLRYLLEVIRYRHFTLIHARLKANSENSELLLGKLWTILEPLLRIAMYGFLFGLFLNTSRGIENFIGYLIIGLTFFSMMSRGLGHGSGLLQRSRGLINTFQFPRASVVLGETVRGFYLSLVPALLAVVAAVLFQLHAPLHWTIVLVIPLLFLINVFAFGLMLITARVTAFVPDAKKIIFFINRAWFYVSGIFFSIERYASHPVVQDVMLQNPAYRFLQAIRGAVMYGAAPSPGEWGILAAWSFGLAAFGFVFFWLAEDRYAYVK